MGGTSSTPKPSPTTRVPVHVRMSGTVALEADAPPPPTKKPTPKPKPKVATLEADAVELANKPPPIHRRSAFVATTTDNVVVEQRQLKSEGDDAFFRRLPRALGAAEVNASADAMNQSQLLFGGAVLLCAAIALLVVKRVKGSKTPAPARAAETPHDAYVRMM